MPDFDRAREVLDQFDSRAAVDVLLLAILIFATMRVVSGTRAMTQLRAVAFLVLVVVVAGRLFHLTVMNFIVEHALTALLIGAAIVLQPEIRRALDRMGRTSLRDWAERRRSSEIIDSIAKAATQMSAERHGGLFVVERGTGLQDVIETGIPVDARVSPELLAGIFYPNSPLHDMAVILRHDRVVAAGCVLPLANDLTLAQRNLGTRHRAALGITEQTDALSVVVSEETGNISIALGGKLTPMGDERRLRAVLEWLLQPLPEQVAAGRGNGSGPELPV